MVFHGDYEVEFEIYEKREGKNDGELLGHMVGIDAFDAKTRWMEAHRVCDEKYPEIYAICPKEIWQ